MADLAAILGLGSGVTVCLSQPSFNLSQAELIEALRCLDDDRHGKDPKTNFVSARRRL